MSLPRCQVQRCPRCNADAVGHSNGCRPWRANRLPNAPRFQKGGWLSHGRRPSGPPLETPRLFAASTEFTFAVIRTSWASLLRPGISVPLAPLCATNTRRSSETGEVHPSPVSHPDTGEAYLRCEDSPPRNDLSLVAPISTAARRTSIVVRTNPRQRLHPSKNDILTPLSSRVKFSHMN